MTADDEFKELAMEALDYEPQRLQSYLIRGENGWAGFASYGLEEPGLDVLGRDIKPSICVGRMTETYASREELEHLIATGHSFVMQRVRFPLVDWKEFWWKGRLEPCGPVKAASWSTPLVVELSQSAASLSVSLDEANHD